MGFSLCILILVIGHAVVSAIAFGISGYFSYTSITQFANNTRYGVLELPEELRQASSIVEVRKSRQKPSFSHVSTLTLVRRRSSFGALCRRRGSSCSARAAFCAA